MFHKVRHLYEFGDFRFDAEKKVLWLNGEIVPLAPKASEVLLLLIERRGDLIKRDELLEKVWQDTFVEEGNLNNAVSALRKALGGNRIIQTVPRRGYRFTAEVQEVFDESEPDLIIEKHTLSHTLIEEEIHDEKLIAQQPFAGSSTKTKRAYSVLAIGSLLLITAIYSALYLRSNSSDNSRIPKTLVILPLQSLNKEDSETAFGLGITESLASRLGSLKKLIVRPTASVNYLAKMENDPIEIGRKLRADTVMTGSYQQADGRIRVTVRLLNVADGSQIWAENFDETEANIFSLQDSLSAQVAKSLMPNLTSDEKTLLKRHYTENIDAYQAYLRGRFHFDKRSKKHFNLAIENYKVALSYDPHFALAYNGLADIYAMDASTQSDPAARAELYRQATEMAEKALAIDEQLADAHASLGAIKRTYNWDWAGAEQHFQRAIELDPNSVNARQWYALHLTTLGKIDEAVAEINKAIELDPLSGLVPKNAITVFSQLRLTEDALAAVEKAIELDPGSRKSLLFLKAGIYVQQGRYQAAIDEAEANSSQKDIKEHSRTMFPIALAYLQTGQSQKARELLREMEARVEKSVATGYYLALFYANTGKEEKAIELLERSYQERDERLVYLKTEPNLDALRSHPRFQELQRKMGLL